MKWLLVLSIIVHCSYTSAQYKKVPDFDNKRNKVNHQVLKGGYKGFKVIELQLTSDADQYDTTSVSYFKYYPSGLIKEVNFYNYIGLEDITNPVFKIKLNRCSEEKVTKYAFDDAGNMLSKKDYIIAPKNSFSALMQVLAEYDRDNGHMPGPGFEDSILKVGIPEMKHLTEGSEFVYNKDGNPIQMKNLVTNQTMGYTYSYKEKLVTMQRSSISTYYFGYDSHGNVDSIIAYHTNGDTIQVNDRKNMEFSSKRKYNTSKEISEDIYTNVIGGYATQTKQIYTYTDTFMTARITMAVNGKADTTEMSLYSWGKNKKMSEEKKYAFHNGKKELTEQIQYIYQGDNIKEVNYFNSGHTANNVKRPDKKQLFFLLK